MNMRVLILSAMLAAPSAAALADTVTTTAAVNLRAGASTDHVVVETLARGTIVSVEACRVGWCLVRSGALTGWVADNYLSSPGAIERYNPPDVVAPPVVKFQAVVPRPYHQFGYGDQHKPNRNFHE